MRSLVVPALALSLAFLPASRAQADEPTPIGVLDLTSELVPEAELRLLTDRLRHELVQTGRFRVMERERMQDILKEQGFQQSGCFATECVIQVGQLIGVQRMVAGSVGKIEDIYTLNIRLINVETGEVVRTAVKDCDCPLTQILTRELAVVAAEIAAPEPERTRGAATGTGEPTYVRGDVFTTVWTRSRSPYIVTGPNTVRSDNVLTIEPGVDVLFQEGAFLQVEGSVQAVGTETDSIRFLKRTAPSWGGIRITGRDSSTFAYVRVSDASHDGNGGGISLRGNVRLYLSHSVVSNNVTMRDGGGIYLSATGLLGTRSPRLTMDYCLVAGNYAARDGGAIYSKGAYVRLVNCSIAGNTALRWGGSARISELSEFTLRNCVVWQNDPVGISCEVTSVAEVTYCDLQSPARAGREAGAPRLAAQTNCIVPNPLFVDPEHGDFHLRPGSPCIDAGDPKSPPDPDGTRPDIGAFYYDQRQGR